jgi:hypothetical protein
MKINLEFTGAALAVTAVRHLELNLQDGATYQDIVTLLADRYPDLIGFILDPDRKNLLSSVLLFVNHKDWIMPGMMERSPQDGDQLILLAVITGG